MPAAHAHFMRVALSWGQRNRGQTWPNPSVGAVVVQGGQIIAAAVTARGGRPHAEPHALLAAGAQAKGATLYVTLEPCAHHGQTPPCVEAIMQSGITTCVIACRDPNPAVNGQGVARLQAAGIRVIEHVCELEAWAAHEGFFSLVERKRPFVSVKIVTSLDGKITHPHQRWLTGAHARNYGHLLRAQHDAIATGIGTVLADDPLLTCRLPGLENCSPLRVVFARNRALPAESRLAQTAGEVTVWRMEDAIEPALRQLAEQGITRLLVEGGAQLTASFLQSGLSDRLYWFHAPLVVGDGGQALASIAAMPPLLQEDRLALGDDVLEIYRCNAGSRDEAQAVLS